MKNNPYTYFADNVEKYYVRVHTPKETSKLLARKTTNIILRVSLLDKIEIERRAREAGLTVSEYIRQRALG